MYWITTDKTILQNGKEKTVKVVDKDRKTGTVHGVADVFHQNIIRYKKHLYKFRHQFNHYKELRSTLKQHEVLLHVDFSENYLCKTADEIQAMHFGASKPQISLHTGIYYVGDKDGTTFATVSDSTDHSPAAVWVHLDPVLDDIKIKFPQIETLHIFSDGLVTQYRQKGNFFLFSSEMGKKGFKMHLGWLVGCFGFNGPFRQYFSLYRAVSQREGERKEK